MKSPHEALLQSAAIEIQVQDSMDSNEDQFISLGYHCATWDFLVCSGVMAEVIPIPRINPVPRSPAYCWGVCNVRGNIVPIFDLSEWIHGKSEFERRDRLYVLLQGGVNDQVGIVVQTIPKSMQFSSAQKVLQSSHVPDKLMPYVKSVYKQDETIWHELDVRQLLKAD